MSSVFIWTNTNSSHPFKHTRNKFVGIQGNHVSTHQPWLGCICMHVLKLISYPAPAGILEIPLILCIQIVNTQCTPFLNVHAGRGWSRRLRRLIRMEMDSWTLKRSTNFFTSWMWTYLVGKSNRCFRSEYGAATIFLPKSLTVTVQS